MELYTLNINVNKQRLSFGENKPEIFSGDQSIDFVEFTFTDDTWNFPNIWAIFSRQKGAAYQIALDDNKVMIPAEVMQKRGYVYIGLMATDGENVQTSNILQYSIGQGSTNVDAITPSASIYEQFLADLDAYQTAVADLDDIESRITTAGTTLTNLEGSISDAEGRLTTIGNQITDAQTDIEEIETAIAQDNIVTDVTGGGVSFVDNHVADLSFMTVTDTATGSIATFPDGSGLNAVHTEIGINPKQSGSGTPSPDNVREISGFSAVEVTDDPVYGGMIKWNQLFKIVRTGTISDGGITIVVDTDGTYTINGTATSNTNIGQGVAFNAITGHKYLELTDSTTAITHAPNWDVRKGAKIINASGSSLAAPSLFFREGETYDSVVTRPQVFDLTVMFGSAVADYIYNLEQTTAGAGVAWFKQYFPNDYYEYNSGEETCVSAVNGSTYLSTTINLGQTVYGATIYPEEGRGLITDGIISSYNGETLPSTWISDRDVYASGTTPTTGAQVCYQLATPIEFTFPAVNIPTLNGTNNVWADSGDISLEYIADIKKYIEKVIS